nr:uncharacterized protein LOC123763726 [Procambarus clarkii]
MVDVPFVFMDYIQITKTEVWKTSCRTLGSGEIVQAVIGTLFGQGFTRGHVPRGSSSLIVAVWLMAVFILGTAYRSNLTASLTQPSYPPRPENVEGLVREIERVTIEPYGVNYKNSFINSDSSALSTFGKLMVVGVDIVDGLKDALEMKRAHVGGRQYLESNIVEHFTRVDGYSPLYIGREMIVPSPTAWPLPHDAPYKHTLDHYIIAITEGGLYEQWRKEMVSEAARKTRTKLKKELNLHQQEKTDSIMEDGPGSNSLKALTLVHMQGPLLLLLLGLAFAGIVFSIEMLTRRSRSN